MTWLASRHESNMGSSLLRVYEFLTCTGDSMHGVLDEHEFLTCMLGNMHGVLDEQEHMFHWKNKTDASSVEKE